MITVDDKSVRDVFRNMDKYDKLTQKVLEEALVKNTLELQTDAKRNILVDTGRARRSTRIKWQTRGGKRLGATVGTYVNYAIFIERKKPYLFPAFDKARTRLIREIRSIFRK